MMYISMTADSALPSSALASKIGAITRGWQPVLALNCQPGSARHRVLAGNLPGCLREPVNKAQNDAAAIVEAALQLILRTPLAEDKINSTFRDCTNSRRGWCRGARRASIRSGPTGRTSQVQSSRQNAHHLFRTSLKARSHFLKGYNLYLTDALFGQVQFLTKRFQCARLFYQHPLANNKAFAL